MAKINIKLSDCTVDALILMCVKNNLEFEYASDERITKVRCIMALRTSRLVDEDTIEHVVTRNIHFDKGSKHRVTASNGMDFDTGIIEVMWVGEPDESIRESEDFQVAIQGMDEEDVYDQAHSVWVGFVYVYPKSVADEHEGITYIQADLLAEHVASL